ncbi:hypothetical protein [Lactobacillus hominis]|uniref:Phage head-tail joining protein n=1 Tax=Lactobacillus hominis DSM 23910 = CRBIP 24.179 TaxID=1423758 RepID=I7L9S2_9LACO|nr:hypothetical protein [Lactobacillus hominis]KRM85825.1 hypothetical protein FC41_GL000010 [Lactobacillus hominis DSM 23910 = CRBIP 24.179]MCT3348944.1 hypothetical protein [Lactobacillus hominis]CCI81634.1 Phage head-tail joining protein [Lactobacillus hominis DSM 23910 = CRBIP 24.179]
MASEILNEQNFDQKIDDLARGWTKMDRLVVNKAGMEAFKPILKSKIDQHRTTGKYGVGYPDHMADTLVTNDKYDGSEEIGFSKEGKKAYIARFINDGWEEYNQHGGPYGHHEGEHYWEKATDESEKVVTAAMVKAAKEVMRRKLGG